MSVWAGRMSPPTIIVAGIVAGTVDIGAACLINDVGAPVVLRAIASGILGRAAFTNGPSMLALGLLLQWAMSILIAAIFLVARVRIPAIRRHTLRAGAAYGLPVYAVMTFVVVPLSNAYPRSSPTLAHAALDIIAMVVFGMIVATAAIVIDDRRDRHVARSG
jgi:uncharacterized membrane protein YagU involved in acid resistance